MSGIENDRQGHPLIVADSHAASQLFGFDGIGLRNVPKSKFMFYVKFHRARSQGGSAWERGLGFVAKSLDRPSVRFKTETLNQYNRKRIVHTDSEFEALNIKFHDTVLEEVQRMFEEYYAFYFNDPTAYSETVINDIVSQKMDPANPFGLKPLRSSDGFFSHVTVYQLFNKAVSTFELVNPKIQSFNPDDLDYAQHEGKNEIQVIVEFEGIRYLGVEPLTPELAMEFGLDATQFYDMSDVQSTPAATSYHMGGNGVQTGIDNFDNLANSLINGLESGNDLDDVLFRSLGGDSLNTFNKTTGVATAQLGVGGLGNLLKGDVGVAAETLLGVNIFGKPGDIF
jgi:hypothetical protein